MYSTSFRSTCLEGIIAFKIDRNPEGWRWELAACMLWPIVIIVAVVRAISGRFVGV